MTYTDFLGFMSGVTGAFYVWWIINSTSEYLWNIGLIYIWLVFVFFLTKGLSALERKREETP
jgi:hypothetical protein